MNSNLSLGAFLPLARMGQLAESAHPSYLHAQPFPHAVFDDFFDPTLLEKVLSEFPAPGEISWHRFDNEREIKLASAAESSFGPLTRIFLYHLNSITFLEFLGKLTGIPQSFPILASTAEGFTRSRVAASSVFMPTSTGTRVSTSIGGSTFSSTSTRTGARNSAVTWNCGAAT